MATTELVKDARSDITMPDEPIYEMASLGEGLVLKSRQAKEFTTILAEHVLELAEFAGDRSLQEPHVVFLARQMEAGTFRWEQVNIVSCVWDGREYRMNGQHTAWARISANLPKNTRTPIQWLKYEAKTEQDMRQLYATIDRGKPRLMGNVVVSYLADRPEFPGYSKSLLRRLAEGLSIWLWGERETRTLHTGDERAYLLLTEHHKVAMYVGSFIRESEKAMTKHLMRAGVFGAMFATFDKAPNIAKTFWEVVRDGVGATDKYDSRNTLRHYLLTSSIDASANRSPDIRTVSGEEMYRACLLAWNAYRTNRTLKNLRPSVLERRPDVRS